MFKFFYEIVKKDLMSFCDSDVGRDYKFILDTNGDDGKVAFKKYENGEYNKTYTIVTRHPNLVKTLIIGKKSWGLWVTEYALGIAEGSFTKYEILEEFKGRNIDIPESYLIEFNNKIWQCREKYSGEKDIFYWNSYISEMNLKTKS